MYKLIEYLSRYNTIGIFGFGKEGRSFYDFAKKHIPKVDLVIIDQSNGENYLEDLAKVDLVVKSPGISLYNLNIKYEDYNFTSATELFLRFFKNNIIGITGTKGKSTLATVLYNILKDQQKDTILCGNIGIPAFDIIDEIKKDTIVIMELSSHQLDHISYSPHIAVLTNIFKEHLDYYDSFQSYKDAKLNILKFQNSDDIAIDLVNNKLGSLKYNYNFTIKQGFIHKTTLYILEKLVDILHLDIEQYLTSIKKFKTLPHRLEYVQSNYDFHIINDSISTIPESTIEAIKILKDVDTILLGGYDRGVDYKYLVKFLIDSNIENIILYSQTGKVIKELFQKYDSDMNFIYKENIKDAILYGLKITKPNKIFLFSPAASSFDSFKNFEQRGEFLKEIISNQ